MKPNFALSLSFDGLHLMHRVDGGWHSVGQVGLDDPDLTGALDRLRRAAEGLDPAGITTKLLIPNDQIKYLAIDGTRASDDDVRDALQGATPYAVDDLVYDFAKGGGRTYVAAVARETLTEAEQFAAEHGFNPVSFAAVPEPFTFVGEAFFGGVLEQPNAGTVERDVEPVVVIGAADVTLPAADPAPQTAPDEAAVPEPVASGPEVSEVHAAMPHDSTEGDAMPDTPPEGKSDEPEDVAQHEATQDVEVVTHAPAADDTASSDAKMDEGTEAQADITPAAAPPLPELDTLPDTPAKADTAPPAEDAAPMFASRLRANRDEGRPAAAPAPNAKTTERAEPTVTRPAAPPLAVPTGSGTDPMPPLFAPNRAADSAPMGDAGTRPLTPRAPDPTGESSGAAPAITGDAPTALPPGAAVAAASLTVDPDPVDPPADPEPAPQDRTSPAAAALGAASAVGGAVGGMFASRRMARAEAKSKSTQDAAADTAEAPGSGDEKSRLTVFGARKKPQQKPKAVVGGKPRFLGLILTAVLLLFLLAIAAFAALSEDGLAAWFGFGDDDTQIAATAPAVAAPPASEVATADPEPASEIDADAQAAADALATPTPPSGGQVLTPEEAARIYAATGVWQRAPRIPLTPRTTTLDDLVVASQPPPVVRVPASPLADASSVAGDALIATPIDPPPPSQTFDFDADGLVVATPEGAVTPDGILVIVGRPPLNPPTRPGTVAPEITPQDQLAAVVPDAAVALPDAPEGVIVIAGRPSIEPPVRAGTVTPTPEIQVPADGVAPLAASDGLLVLAGAPPVLPPVRPGTLAPTSQSAAQPAAVEALPELDTGVDLAATVPTGPSVSVPDGDLPEGLNVVAGQPPVLPPVRPGTTAPQTDAAVTDAATDQAADAENLLADVAAALTTGTAQTPTADTPRPLTRPAAIIEAAAAAAAAANAPILGELTADQAAGFRPRTRPAGLAPPAPEPTPEPDQTAVEPAPAAPTGLQISPEIAAAVEAAANRPNPIVNPTAQAVARSERPDTRPRNMDRIVARAEEAAARAATQVAAAPVAAAVAPSGPTGGSVATAATLENAINLRDINLIGIYGGSDDRRALVRLSNGRYVRVTVGDRLDGGRVTAISAAALSYTKRGRAITLQVPS